MTYDKLGHDRQKIRIELSFPAFEIYFSSNLSYPK